MIYLLDTTICSYIIKHRPQEVLAKFKTLRIEDCGISAITYTELKYWVTRNKRLHAKRKNTGCPKINEEIIDRFVSHSGIIEFDAHAAEVYALTREALEAQGIGRLDDWFACD